MLQCIKANLWFKSLPRSTSFLLAVPVFCYEVLGAIEDDEKEQIMTIIHDIQEYDERELTDQELNEEMIHYYSIKSNAN
jgi:hypothetical protein